MGFFLGYSMKIFAAVNGTPARTQAAGPQLFIRLEDETRPAVGTAAAAHYLNRKPQTLRCWSMCGDGPLNPIRVHGRLAWKTSDLRTLLGIA